MVSPDENTLFVDNNVVSEVSCLVGVRFITGESDPARRRTGQIINRVYGPLFIVDYFAGPLSRKTVGAKIVNIFDMHSEGWTFFSISEDAVFDEQAGQIITARAVAAEVACRLAELPTDGEKSINWEVEDIKAQIPG